MVILEDTPKSKAYELAEEFKEKFQSIEVNPILKVTFSGGISGSEDADLVSKADELLYKAKRNGKNRVEI